jgi:hypothetical protein
LGLVVENPQEKAETIVMGNLDTARNGARCFWQKYRAAAPDLSSVKAKRRLNETELVELLRSECRRVSVRQWALEHEVGASLIWDILRYKTRPSPKIYFALGYRRVVEYERMRG